ncbi:hypothetical protein BGY98DRAFT_1103163 [Russula aff. rugulosa BPL654]|nr:hypothetical protein BGY98DRAFT_1103163 [Russula aff. rugulosa BPL654]
MSSDSTSGHNCGSGSRSPKPPSVPRSVFSVARSGRERKRRSNNHDDFYDDDDFAPASAPTPYSPSGHRRRCNCFNGTGIIYDKEKASSAQIQTRLDSIWREHGDSYIEGIQPVFDALKARHFDSSWNWVRQDAILMFYEILLGRLTTVDREITARCIAIMIPPAQLPRPPDYFLKKYNISLQHADDLAIIDVGGPGRSNYIPAELCNIEPGEPHLGKVGPKETSDMLEVASRKPAENTAIIMENGLPRLGYKPSTSVLQSFNIHLASQMAVIPGRELPLPSVTYGKGTPRVQNGSWNILDVKFHHGAKMTNWKVLVVRDGMDAYSFSGPRDERLISFIKAFANKCRNSGMEVGNEPPHIVPTDQLPPEPTILVGIDVTLLGPAVDFVQFPASLRLQKSKQEGIAELSDMIIERLQAFRRRSNVLPKRIIIFRDGVSEKKIKEIAIGLHLSPETYLWQKKILSLKT